MLQQPYVYPAAITREQARQIVDIICKPHKHATRNDPLRAEIAARNLQGPDRDLLKQTLEVCQQIAIKGLGITKPIYPEFTLLQANRPGDGHEQHADNAKLEKGQWVQNHTPQRVVSAGLYLNNDFAGGELIFPQHNLKLKPRTGTLVAFPSNQSCLHEVYKVRAGNRYSVIIWRTDDPAKQENWQ